jgi:hypothetical protein
MFRVFTFGVLLFFGFLVLLLFGVRFCSVAASPAGGSLSLLLQRK